MDCDIDATQVLDLGLDVPQTELEDVKREVAKLKTSVHKNLPEEKEFSIYDGTNIVGRDDRSDITIKLQCISKKHACIEVENGAFLVYDLDSRNKSRKGQILLKPFVRYELNDGDKLTFGDLECDFVVTFSEDLDETKSLSGSETGSESLIPEDEEEAFQLDEDINSLIESKRISSVVGKDFQNDSTMSEGFILPTQYDKAVEEEEENLNTSNLSDSIILPTQHAGNDKFTCQETPKSEKNGSLGKEEEGVYAMDSDQEDSEERRDIPDPIGETPGAALKERRSAVFDSPLVINESKNDESIPSPSIFDANSSKAKKGLVKFRNSNFTANVVFRSPPCTHIESNQVDGKASSEDDEPPATFVFDAADFNKNEDDDDTDDEKDDNDDDNEEYTEQPQTYVFDAGDFDKENDEDDGNDKGDEEIKDDEETDMETDVDADVDVFDTSKTTLDYEDVHTDGDNEDIGTDLSNRTFTRENDENACDTSKTNMNDSEYQNIAEEEEKKEENKEAEAFENEISAHESEAEENVTEDDVPQEDESDLADQATQAYESNIGEQATQAYDSGVSGETTQAYEFDVAGQSTQAYDNGVRGEATQAYESDVAGQATQAYDNGVCGEATQAYESDVAGQATQAYDNGVCGEATQAYESDVAGQSTQAYDNDLCSEATQAYENDVADDATQAYTSLANENEDEDDDMKPTQPYQFSDSEDIEATQPYQITSPIKKSPVKKGNKTAPILPTLPGGSSSSELLLSDKADTHYDAVDASTGMNSDNDLCTQPYEIPDEEDLMNEDDESGDNNQGRSEYDDVATQQYVVETTSSSNAYDEVSTQLYTLEDEQKQDENEVENEEEKKMKLEKKKKRKSVRFSIDVTDRKKYPARRSKGKRCSDESENSDVPTTEPAQPEGETDDKTPTLNDEEIEVPPTKRKARGKKAAVPRKPKARSVSKASSADIDEVDPEASNINNIVKDVEPELSVAMEEEKTEKRSKNKRGKKPTFAELKRQKEDAKKAEKMSNLENVQAENDIDMKVEVDNNGGDENENLEIEASSPQVMEEDDQSEVVSKRSSRTNKAKKPTKAELKRKKEEEKMAEIEQKEVSSLENVKNDAEMNSDIKEDEKAFSDSSKVIKSKRARKNVLINQEQVEEASKINEVNTKSAESPMGEESASSSKSRRGQPRANSKIPLRQSRAKSKSGDINDDQEKKNDVNIKPVRSSRSRKNTATEPEKEDDNQEEFDILKDNTEEEKVEHIVEEKEPEEKPTRNNRKKPARNRKNNTEETQSNEMEVDENVENREDDFLESKKVTGRKNSSKKSNQKTTDKVDNDIVAKVSVEEKDSKKKTEKKSIDDNTEQLNVDSTDDKPLPEVKKTNRRTKPTVESKTKKVTKRTTKSVTTCEEDTETEKENEVPAANEKLGTPRRSVLIKPKVIFTGMNDKSMEKIVTDLGGEIVDNILAATHLVTDKVRRTVKFLCAVARGIHIVHPEWLIASKVSKTFTACQRHILKDESAERQYKFQLQPSLEKAKDNPLFAEKNFYVTKNVKPERAFLKEMIEAAGGTYLARVPRVSSNVIVVSCAEDEKEYTKLVSKGFTTCTKEIVLSGLLRQQVDTEQFSIDNLDDLNCSQLSTISDVSIASSKRKVLETKDSPSKRKRRK